jgi:NitT/TauT family transport system substrate-binding protein
MRHPGGWLALLMLALVACAGGSSGAEPLRLRLVTWPGYAPLYAVAEHDLAAPTRLDVSTSELAQDNYRAFAEGRIDVLATTLHSAIQFYDQGTETVIIMVTDYSNGADGIIARPGIDDVADLSGQRVGVESGSVSHYVLLRALHQTNISEDEIEIVNVVVGQAIDAIKEGDIDAAVVWEPVLSEYVRDTNTPPLFTTAAIPNEVIDVLVVHPDLIEERPEDLRNLLRGWNEAVQLWRADSPQISATMARTMTISEEDLRRQLTKIELVDLERNSRLLCPDGPYTIQPSFQLVVTFLRNTGQLEREPPTPEQLLTVRFVDAALQDMDDEKEGSYLLCGSLGQS